MPVVECPGCFSDLRVPPYGELARLSQGLQEDAPFVQAVKLRCKFCGTLFSISEAQDEMQQAAAVNAIIRDILAGR